VYRRDDLAALLPLGRLESLATFGQSYRLALTPGLLTRVFGTGVDSGLLNDAGYVQIEEGHEWWIPFARAFFSGGDRDRPEAEVANARAHFYVHRRVIDAFGAIHRVDYDPYDLLPIRTTDPVGNITSGANDYRVLEPVEVTDPNGNRAQASLDALGLIAGTAVMGKPTEHVGDSLGDFDPDPDPSTVLAHLREPLQNPAEILGCASTRFVYDMFAFYRTRADAQPRPPVTYTLARETHVSDLDPEQESRYRHVFIYGDGLGREVQRKVQAPRDPSTGGPRWIGSGWTIFNNKGDPVRTYEPFFTSTHEFEFAVAVGVSTNLFYDPARRVVATLHPNGTWAKVVLNNWRQESWDVNDTVLIADPRTDPDVGDHFRRLLGDEGAFVSWYEKRIGGHYGATAGQRTAERNAAQKAATHARTPIVSHFDVLGRACLTVLDNGADGRYPSRVALDAENKPLAVFDTMGRRACEYCVREETDVGGVRYIAGHDMAGNLLYHVRMDSGARRTLASVSGDQVRAWDARGQVFDVRYDLARRPTHRYVSPNGRAPVLLERLVYGEGLHGQNLCGRLFRRYDGAGVATNERYDFKGNLLQSRRQFAQRYDETVDWNALSDVTREADLDAAASPLLNPADSFLTTTTFDALNRVIQSVTPHSATMRPNILRHSYNEAGLLQRLDVWTQRHSDSRKQLELGTADLHPIRDITYNARGQRTTLLLGNGTFTTFRYDAQTFQLTQLQTLRRSGFERDQRVVQNLAYTYDPAGNITRISDDADLHNVIFFRNRRVEPSADYTYDPIYRLIRASGREHVGQARSSLRAPQQVTNDDGSRIALPHPADGHAMGRYTERYNYDSVGNVLAMMHQATGGSWRRHYRYAETSQITGAETCNRLTATSLPGSPPAGPYSATYSHDAHGNMTRMPHLPELAWDEHDRLRSTAGQVVNVGTPETTFYAYDADGQRLRKATDRQATRPRQAPTRRRERLYLGGVEIYREYGSDGLRVTLTRETLHVVDGTQRVALIETRTALHGSDPAPPQLVRYQYSNHLGSAVLELDHQAQVISYEEYYPYGSTAYEAGRSQTETPKRYRYTGKERDEESGLYYYGARYYAPWLARWTSCDPVVFSGAAAEQFRGDQHYVYVENRPTVANDPDGRIIWFVVIAAVVITALTVESAANAPANAQQAARAEPAVSDAEFAAHAAVNAATLAAGGAASGRVLTGTGSRVLAGAAGGGVAGVTGAPLNRAVSDVARGQVSSPGQYVTDAVTGAAVGAGIGAAGGAVSRVVRGPVPSRSGSPPAPSEASNQGGTGAGTRGAVDAAKPMVTAPDTGATPPTPSVGGATPDPGRVATAISGRPTHPWSAGPLSRIGDGITRNKRRRKRIAPGAVSVLPGWRGRSASCSGTRTGPGRCGGDRYNHTSTSRPDPARAAAIDERIDCARSALPGRPTRGRRRQPPWTPTAAAHRSHGAAAGSWSRTAAHPGPASSSPQVAVAAPSENPVERDRASQEGHHRLTGRYVTLAHGTMSCPWRAQDHARAPRARARSALVRHRAQRRQPIVRARARK
jgi:RHS repeat-associated protein